MAEKNTKKLTKWHELLGTLLKYLLIPVDISVSTNFSVMSKSPEVDILLLRRSHPQWTAKQLALLPDGVRDSQASDILLEFKYTQSFNEDTLLQALSYDFLYKQHNKKSIKPEDVQTFVLSAQHPHQKTLTQFGYENTSLRGVYHSHFELARKIVLLSLNELPNQPHNAFVKCFASRKKEKENAFKTLKRMGLNSFTIQLQQYLAGLKQLWFFSKGDDMKIELTPEMVIEMGKEWGDVYLSSMPAEEVLRHFEPQERLAGLKPQEILAALKPQELDELTNYINKHQQQKT